MLRRAPERPSTILLVVPLALVLASFAGVVWQVAVPLGNPDTFFHIRMGHEFLGPWSAGDPGSVTRFATAEWVPTQWLGQVGIAAFEGWFGLPGVAWLEGTAILLLALVVFLVSRAHGSLVAAAFLLPMTLVACAPALSARPQVLSYLFAAMVTGGWLRAHRDGTLPWWVVPLTWVWAMTHGMWPVALVISVAAVVGLAADRRLDRKGVLRALAVPLLALVAAGLTPVGPGVYGAVARVGSITEYFTEWQPPSFTDPAPMAGGAMLALLVLVAVRKGDVPWTRVLLTAVAAGWLVYSTRTVALGAVMLAPLLAAELHRVVPDRGRPGRTERAVVLGGALAALAALTAAVPFTSEEPPTAPEWQDARMADLPDGTGLLNEWGEGGFDMWRHPHLDVVMHGYGDMFTDAELERNFGMTMLEPGWDEDLRDLEVTHALLLRDSPLRYALVTDKAWRVVEEDDDKSYLVAPSDWPGSAG